MKTPSSRFDLYQSERLEQRLEIQQGGRVTVRSGKVEYGQGIRTGFARIVADELSVSVQQIDVVLGETDNVPWDVGTVGSMSTATDGRQLRAAAIQARTLLLDRAGTLMDLPPSTLFLLGGCVMAPDDRAIPYEDLVRNEPLTGPIPDFPGTPNRALDAPASKPMRLEARSILTGKAKYPADIRLPGMLRGHMLHSPRPGMKLALLEDSLARAVPGATVIRDGDFAGVVADRDEALFAALHALRAEWITNGDMPGTSYAAVMRLDDDVESMLLRAACRLKATYHAPHIAHASILPRAAVADVQANGVDLYVATQNPFALREEAAAMIGLPAAQIHIHPQTMSGMYGRGNSEDVAIEALRLSRAARRPVLVQWSRAEEFRLSPHRPVFDAEIEAGLDRDGAIIGWRGIVSTNPYIHGPRGLRPGVPEMSAGRNAEPPYRLGRADIRLHVEPGAIPTMSFRSLGAAPNVFAIECFIDELAHASGQDPIDFRLKLIDDSRLRHVLETVRVRSEWWRPRQPGQGLGVACAIYHGTYIAQIAEVSAAPTKPVRLLRMWCAVDAGRLVHPDGARNQIEGGVQQAASWTLLEELKMKEGAVMSSSWRDYPIATFHDAPRLIDVAFVGDPDTPSTGVGEPGSVPTAAAIVNAVFAACGKRIRKLPIGAALS
jgi:nicotinate dehydrogenase subunit B